jgi:hypothetical protein
MTSHFLLSRPQPLPLGILFLGHHLLSPTPLTPKFNKKLFFTHSPESLSFLEVDRIFVFSRS